jgi:hypothetical protein
MTAGAIESKSEKGNRKSKRGSLTHPESSTPISDSRRSDMVIEPSAREKKSKVRSAIEGVREKE